MPPFRDPPSVHFDAIANFRDMGGHTTRDGARVAAGRLFRSGHLAHATSADLGRLDELGLRRILDFRTLADIEVEGSDRLPRTAKYTRLPMPDLAKTENLRTIIQGTKPERLQEMFGDGKAAAMMVQSAASLVRDRREPYGHFLAELANSDSLPALFHCSAGKDRAGWAGSVVLLTLGVGEDQVVEQYLLSNRALDAIRERLQSGPDGDESSLSEKRRQTWGSIMRPFLEVRREYIEASFKAIQEHWGSFDRYLIEGLGITEQQREQLREGLLE